MATMEERVTSLEERVTHLEANGRQGNETAEAAMAAHHHNTRLIMALRETQLEHGQRLSGIDAKLAEHDQRFEAIDQRFEAVDRRFDEVDRRFEAVDRRFDEVDRRFDEVDRRFDEVNTEIASMKGTLGRVAVGMYTLEKLIRRIVSDDGDDANN